MKVLYINAMGPTEKNPLGGIFVSQRIVALRKLGVDVIPVNIGFTYSHIIKILLRLIKGKDCVRLLQKQLDVFYKTILVKKNFIDTWKARMDPIAYKKIFRREIYKELNNIADIDIIHLHWCWPVGLVVSELAKERKIPYVFTFHGSDINITLQNSSIRPALLKIMEDASSVEFVSNALLNTAIKYGYTGKNAVVIYNGIDTEIYKRKRYNKTKKCVGFVGNLISVKGADRLPEIYLKIMEKYKGAVEFVIVGQGVLEEELKEKLKGKPVTFLGQLSPKELADIYNYMDVLIVPSRSEGYSCVIKEAQACGVIPIGNAVGGIPEAVGKYGCIIKEEKEEKLVSFFAERTINYLENKEQIDLEAMVLESQKCTWIERQKMSLENYRTVL